jgi:hypothetical protein
MNAHLKELSTLAWAYAARVLPEPTEFSDVLEQKFAELIVLECVQILNSVGAMQLDPTTLAPYNEGWVNGRKLAIDQIKKQFGLDYV